MQDNYDFKIKPSKWQRKTFLVLIIGGALVLLGVFAVWLIFRFDWGLLVGTALICLIEFMISGLGLFVCYREEFSFQQGVFTYAAAFRKKKAVDIKDVARVEIDVHCALPRITFVGKDEKVLIRFFDDGTSFKDNQFVGALIHYDVPIVRKMTK